MTSDTGSRRRSSVSRLSRVLVILAIASMSSVSTAAAQAVYGSISGTVSDSTGGVLPGATVVITSVERKTVDTVIANESGFYVKDRLLPGVYEVKADLQGFKSAIVPKVQVAVDTQVPINFKLEVGSSSEEITVTGGAPLLKTDRADVATRFDTKELTELPVLDRNFTKFILLTPGAQQLGWQHAASENPQGSTQIQINGQHFSGTGYQLDGTENRDPILGIIVVNPTLESVGESKVTSQNYDAEFGQATAGVVSVQTKSGTNSIHGSAFEFYSSEALQARNPFTQARVDPLTGKFIPDTKRNQFGGSVGGPIVQNKWFFFGDYQGTRQDQGGSRLLSVPTDLARTGNFSEYGVRVFDPQSGQEFANATVPSGRISQQALNILQLIPRANAPGRVNGTRDNFTASGIEKFEENSINVRIDGRLSDKINTFGRYSLGDFLRDGPTALGQGGGPDFVSLGGVSDVRNHSLAYGVDYALSSTLLADFRFGFFNYRVDVLPFDFGTRPAADAGIPNINNDATFTSGLPAMFMRGNQEDMNWGSGLGVNRCNCPLAQNEKQWQAVGNLTKLMGNHSFKFGLDIRRAYNLRVPSDSHRSGEMTFNHERTSSPTLGGGLGLATFMLGDVTGFNRYVSTSTDARERQWRHFYYAQDTWRVNTKFTLNYGLRLDVINPQTVNEPGNGTWVDLTTGRGLVGGVGNVDLGGQHREPFELGAAARRGVPIERQDRHPRRVRHQLRHRRVRVALRTHCHPESPGARGAEPEPARSVRFRLHPRARPPQPQHGGGRLRWDLPVAGRGHAARHATHAAAAAGRSMEHHRPETIERHDVVRGRLRRQPRTPRVRREQPGRARKHPGDRWLPGRAAESAPALLRRRRSTQRPRHRGEFRMDAERPALLQRGAKLVSVDADQAHASLLRRMVCPVELHTAAGRAGAGRLLDLRS